MSEYQYYEFQAIVLLRDLHDVCVHAGRQAEATARVSRLREEHANKRSLIRRIREAGFAK